MTASPVPPHDPGHAPMTVYGRQGSPTITVALPFARVETSDDSHLLAATAELAQLVERLAAAAALTSSATRRDELARVATAASDLVGRLASPTAART